MRALFSLVTRGGLGLFFLMAAGPVPTSAQDAASVLSKFQSLPYGEREKGLIEGAKKEGKVVYYGSGDIRDNQEIIRAFQQRYPFLEVEFSGGGGGKVVQRARTEFLARHYVLDVVNANAFRIPPLIESGALGKYASPHEPNLTKELLDPKRVLWPLYTTAIVIAYNSQEVQGADVPKSYNDLLHPRWKGRKMALDTEAHSWFMGILGTLGEKEGLDYSRKLAAQELVRRRGHTLMSQLLIVGEYVVQVEAYLHTVFGLKQKGAPVDYTVTDPLILRPPSAIALAKNAPHPHAAALFMDFLLSDSGAQRVFANQDRWPANKKTPSKVTIGNVRVWAPELDVWLPKQAEVLSKFDEIFGAKAR